MAQAITPARAAAQIWDVAVIGSGPAGSTAARLLVLKGCSVLLLDKSEFPRGKVCGCCLNGNVLKALKNSGLEGLEAEAAPLQYMRLYAEGRSCRLALPSSAVLSRETLDMLLIRRAIDSGVVFLPAVTARVGGATPEWRLIDAFTGADKVQLQAKIVLVADGLSGRSLSGLREFTPVEDPCSRVGAGTTIMPACDFYAAGTVFMACHPSGYVGLVRLPDGRLDVAAAWDREFSRQFRKPSGAAAEIMRQAGLPAITSLREADWRGTGTLTRRRSVIAAERVFVIGDAAAYVEPFTGQGIAWAVSSALQVVPLAIEAVKSWQPELSSRWQDTHSRSIGKAQRLSRKISGQLRKPCLLKSAIGILNLLPHLADPLIEHLAG